MSLSHSVTAADVQRIYAAEILAGKTAEDARRGTRTTVQTLIASTNPPPMSDFPPEVKAVFHPETGQQTRPFTAEEKDAIRRHTSSRSCRPTTWSRARCRVEGPTRPTGMRTTSSRSSTGLRSGSRPIVSSRARSKESRHDRSRRPSR